jgi:hypothetical protein
MFSQVLIAAAKAKLEEAENPTSMLDFFAHNYKIISKSRGLVSFTPNSAQQYIHSCLEKQKQDKGKVKAIILKGRQQGISTYIQARYYYLTTHNHGTRAYIMSHQEDSSTYLFGIAKRIHENMPGALGTKVANKRELVFNSIESGYRVATAGGRGVGRSETIRLAHLSELAYYMHAEEHLSGILQSIPIDNSEIIIESTSAGPSGLFYQLWQDAVKGNNDFAPIFVPWSLQPEYVIPIEDDFSLTGEEEELTARYDLTPEQLNWRRYKIRELRSPVSFSREYPLSPEDAFSAEPEGAIFKREWIRYKDAEDYDKIVIAVDPALTSNSKSDETGIIV